MSAHGERTLMLHLLDAESLEVLAKEGLPEDMIPTEDFRSIVRWCIEYWHRSGRLHAPSISALRSEPGWANVLDDHELPLGDADPEDSIEWAIDDLKSSYAHLEAQRLLKKMATDLAEAEQGDIPEVVDVYANEMVSLSISLTPRDQQVDVREGAADRLLAYEAREIAKQQFLGMRFGLDAIDHHTFGIHDGELCVGAAGPKVGKSYLAALIALAEWKAGRPTALFTLENHVDMTIDRMACLAARVDYALFQRGECDEEDIENVREWVTKMADSSLPLYVLQPDLGKRSVEQMTRQAQIMDVDSMLIDQLTFVELGGDPRASKTERIGITLHTLKGMISTGRKNLPCFLAHQINRDGVRYAMKNGYHTMLDLAESSEVERTADMVFSIYRSKEMRQPGMHEALVQTLAARRFDIKWWSLDWNLGSGDIKVKSEVPVVA